MMNDSSSGNSLQRNVREISERQKIASALADHLDNYFEEIDADNFAEASPEELHGAATQHHRLGFSRPAEQASIALYTPDFDRHGWHSPHTVIDIVTDDMPFLVDSVTMVIYNKGLVIHRLMHPVLGIERDKTGTLQRSTTRGSAGTRNESWIHLEIDRIGDREQQKQLQDEISQVLADIRAAVEDFGAMRQRVDNAISDLAVAPNEETPEIVEFLRWSAKENFVFLGYAHFGADNNGAELKRTPDGGLGLLRNPNHPRFGHCRAGIPSRLTDLEKLPSALTLVKADARSIVHRSGYLDFIGVLQRDASGKVVGQHMFVGLYAAHVYHISTKEIPVVRGKIAAVRAACDFVAGGHNDKTLRNTLETYPRDELIEIETEDLLRIAHGIVMLHEHQRVRVFLRNDRWCRYVSALIYMPRDRFDTNVRLRIMTMLSNTLHAGSVDFFINVDESRLARLHLITRTPDGTCYEYDAEAIEREVARLSAAGRMNCNTT